jgi:23S rRNA (cytidine1920-2'-O)/16S rRNA (cytidine1409-2'-O)-methyltransferase
MALMYRLRTLFPMRNFAVPIGDMSEPFVSRAGRKLDHAIGVFGVDVTGKICADLGCNVGGFTDCLLQRGAGKVYAVDTAYGVLDWILRNDKRVVVMERTNAMHAQFPEKMQIVTIDVAWTKQKYVLPAAGQVLAPDGVVVTLVKPHYEAPENELRNGVLPEEKVEEVLKSVRHDARESGFVWEGTTTSPIKGHGGNVEVLALLRPGK